jgi:hypothetical protein
MTRWICAGTREPAKQQKLSALPRGPYSTTRERERELVGAQERAVADLVRLIELYPPDTQFFLNAWTPGYEDGLEEEERGQV